MKSLNTRPPQESLLLDARQAVRMCQILELNTTSRDEVPHRNPLIVAHMNNGSMINKVLRDFNALHSIDRCVPVLVCHIDITSPVNWHQLRERRCEESAFFTLKSSNQEHLSAHTKRQHACELQ